MASADPAAETPAGVPDVVATTDHEPTHGHGPELLGLHAEQWVYVSLFIFILLTIFVAKAPQKIAAMLDKRIAETRRQLDEARTVRAEAEQLLAQARSKQAESQTHASKILAHAEAEAANIIGKAQTDAEALVERRGRMAEDKIAAEERAAVQQLRATAAEAATKAAARLIAERLDSNADAAVIDSAIAEMGRR